MGRFLIDYTYYPDGKCEVCQSRSSNIVEYLNKSRRFIVCNNHSPETYEQMTEIIKEEEAKKCGHSAK